MQWTSVLPRKAKRQYLLTLQVSGYCLLALPGRVDGTPVLISRQFQVGKGVRLPQPGKHEVHR